MNILDKVGISHLLLVLILMVLFISVEIHQQGLTDIIGALGIPGIVVSIIYTIELYRLIKRMDLSTYALYIIGIIVSDLMALIVILLAIR